MVVNDRTAHIAQKFTGITKFTKFLALFFVFLRLQTVSPKSDGGFMAYIFQYGIRLRSLIAVTIAVA